MSEESNCEEHEASRISVLDALEFDRAIYDVLKKQTQVILSYLPDRTALFQPEIDALLRTTLWMVSVHKSFATFGQQLLHLKYASSTPPWSIKTLGLLEIGSIYVKERLSYILSRINDTGLVEKIMTWIEKLETVLKYLNILSFILFLRKGGASTFPEIILNANPVSTIKPSSRNVGYSYMTRELLWHGLIELLGLAVPMINYHKVKRIFRSKYVSEPLRVQNPILLPETKCPICRETPIIPHSMGCSHIFCHYCLASHRLADSKFDCPICGLSNPDPNAMVPVTAQDF